MMMMIVCVVGCRDEVEQSNMVVSIDSIGCLSKPLLLLCGVVVVVLAFSSHHFSS
jgi:hypothetical protein